MSNFPLYSVIIDGIEAGTAGSDDDAQEIAGGFDIVFIDELLPKDFNSLEMVDTIETTGYYVKADSEDFNKTELSKNLNKLVAQHTPFSNLTTTKSSEDFSEMSVWSLKDLILAVRSL